MANFDLLGAVQPATGIYAVVGIKEGEPVRQEMLTTREEVEDFCTRMVARKYNVFFGVAKYKDQSGRKKDNVRALKAFWLDIDCGEDKATPDPKTGIPKGYDTQTSALHALRAFLAATGLPLPTIVNSGRGLHLYWSLTEEVTPTQWEPVAAQLRELCKTHGLHVDPSVFETARILRIPGTLNFKDEVPSEVTVVKASPPTDFARFAKLLGMGETPEPVDMFPAIAKKRPLTALGQSMAESVTKSFSRIMTRKDSCEQLRDAVASRATLAEVRWFDALSVAKFCTDKDKALLAVSAGHPDYDEARTEQKLEHITGPHSCRTFDSNNPGLCQNCPHWGKITGPIMLGKEVEEATNVEVAVEDTTGVSRAKIPDPPSPFCWGKNGGLWKVADPDTEPLFVYEHYLYVVKRMNDPALGDVAMMRLHLPRDGVREFIVPNAKIMDGNELRKLLAAEGVVCGVKRFGLIVEYVIAAISGMQHEKKAELMRMQFGWCDNDSKFIIGDQEITAAGSFYSPPSSATKETAIHMRPMGELDKWKEVFNLYGKPGLEPHSFAALTGFGAPLFRFTGQRGAVVNVIHPSSGTGKTTILHMCSSIYGNPPELCSTQKDTENSRMHKLGVYNNLPFCVDEITNMNAAQFSDLIYAMSNGKGKDRMESSSNKLRANHTKWQTIGLCSSNASFYEKLSAAKNSPDGETMRMIEYKIEEVTAIPVDVAKHMFDHQLLNNYGHAGPIYADYLVKHREEIVEEVLSVQSRIDRECQLTQRERFWSAQIAANITGGLIAKSIGLLDWDMRAIYRWAVDTLLPSLREEVRPPTSSGISAIGDYLNRHISNMLVVEDKVDRRTGIAMTKLPVREPTRELLIRYEPDTKLLFINQKHFKDDCVARQTNYQQVLEDLKMNGVYLDTKNKGLSKGMELGTPVVRCLCLDTSVSAFAAIGGTVEPEVEEDEGSGS